MARKEKTKSKLTRLPSVEELYGGGYTGRLMKGEFAHRKDIHDAIQRRHERGVSRIDEEGYWVQDGSKWKVPYGVKAAFRNTLVHAHLMSKYPYYVQWRHPDGNGGVKIKRRSCMSLGAACSFVATKATRVDPDAFVVCKLGFRAPLKLLGKFPRRLSDGKLYYWCPRCMQPRRYRQVDPPQSFYADKKYWDTEKERYVWKNVKLAVMECTSCGATNRDAKFRASNQPVEKTVVKPGRRRVRRRR